METSRLLTNTQMCFVSRTSPIPQHQQMGVVRSKRQSPHTIISATIDGATTASHRRDNVGLGFQHIVVARDRLQRMCNIRRGPATTGSSTPASPARGVSRVRPCGPRKRQYNLISPVGLTKTLTSKKRAPTEGRRPMGGQGDRVAILTMPVLLDRESQRRAKFQRHRAHLHDIVVVLRFALGPFPGLTDRSPVGSGGGVCGPSVLQPGAGRAQRGGDDGYPFRRGRSGLPHRSD